MKRRLATACVVLFLGLITSCSAQSSTDLTPSKFNEMNGKTNVQVIDVRTSEELKTGIISGAAQIDFAAPDFKTSLFKLDRNKTYLVYCTVGGRSSQAVKILRDQGVNAYNLKGGIKAWKEEKFPVVKK